MRLRVAMLSLDQLRVYCGHEWLRLTEHRVGIGRPGRLAYTDDWCLHGWRRRCCEDRGCGKWHPVLEVGCRRLQVQLRRQMLAVLCRWRLALVELAVLCP